MENHATTCTCAGLNTHLNFGMDLALGVGEINLNFNFDYENTNYQQQRYFSGQLIDFNLFPQTDLVCLDCEGCVATLKSNTAADGWTYNKNLNAATGQEIGWEHHSPPMSVWVWVGVGIGAVALLAGVGVAVFKDVGGVRSRCGGGEEVAAINSALQRVGFKAGVGGGGRKGGAMEIGGDKKDKRGSAMGKRGSVTEVGGGGRRSSAMELKGVKMHGAPKAVSAAGKPTQNYV